jgi:hypothetical protein
MTDYLLTNWLTLLSLAVALIGGVPGIIAVLEHMRRGPAFGVTVPNFVTGEQLADGTRRTMILLTLTIWNRGETPIAPGVFDLDVKIKRRWIRFDRFLIPDEATFQGERQQIVAPISPASDLQRFKGSVTREQPAYGYLMFVTDRVARNQLQQVGHIPIRITCKDASDRNHRFKLILRGERVDADTEYPQHGLIIKPNAPKRESI